MHPNTDLILRTNGSGTVNLEDDKKLSFGTDEDADIRYDNSANQVIVNGVEWKYEGTKVYFDNVGISSTAISINLVEEIHYTLTHTLMV